MKLPRMIQVQQRFESTAPVDLQETITSEFKKFDSTILPGQRIAVGVGSRGITNMLPILLAVIHQIQKRGAQAFVIPAMGSHGGATPAGQRAVLESYGITESSIGVPIHDSLEVQQVGQTSNGTPVFCSVEALGADGTLLLNRIKPHTDFFGDLGSGLLKMSVIGLGKRRGAATMHLNATRFGYEPTIRAMAQVQIEQSNLLGGLAILENQNHQTAWIQALPRPEMIQAETELFQKSCQWMPRIPFEEIDLLIVDRIGKNISGAGMDPNVINRSVHGYNSLPIRGDQPQPFICRIYARSLTPETHGNAIGIGMADAISRRLSEQIDADKTRINALTALTPQSVKLPIVFETDRDAIEAMLTSLPIDNTESARIVQIADTLSVADMKISESLYATTTSTNHLSVVTSPQPFSFTSEGNLP